jgi:hypothetical protein
MHRKKIEIDETRRTDCETMCDWIRMEQLGVNWRIILKWALENYILKTHVPSFICLQSTAFIYFLFYYECFLLCFFFKMTEISLANTSDL